MKLNNHLLRFSFLILSLYGVAGTFGGIGITASGIFGTDGSTVGGGIFILLTGIICASVAVGWYMSARNGTGLPGTLPLTQMAEFRDSQRDALEIRQLAAKVKNDEMDLFERTTRANRSNYR